jgi:hypothetical protein
VIGVLSQESESSAVREFFELFKTPWEFWAPHKKYDLVIATHEKIPRDLNANALVVYSSQKLRLDNQVDVVTIYPEKYSWVEWERFDFPIYGRLAVFQSVGPALVRRKYTSEAVGCALAGSGCATVRVGIDLFYEVAFLLSQGQPAENARVATLDIHILLLRAIMMDLKVPFVEVPPVFPGYDFMACLTHDVDFVGIRDHKGDHTMWGFLYRSTLGSLLKSITGRLPWSKCFQNWKAALSLPLVYLRLQPDFWLEFDRYIEIEKDLGSTFFFIPFKDFSGTLDGLPAPRRRAAKYDLKQLKKNVLDLEKKGCEIGLHGVNAWQDSESAQSERMRLCEVTGQADVGIRMHWLYWSESSALNLERASFTYDSTVGYNNAIGFRSGTTQVFRFLDCEQLLELPLAIQDSAMFYSDRMMLSETEALNACKELIRTMELLGGVLTVNWHTRSLSPERLWGDFYALMLNEIRAQRVWFGTAQEIVGWFRNRRALRFESATFGEKGARVELSGINRDSGSFKFSLRVHDPKLPVRDMRLHTWDSSHFLANKENSLQNREVLEMAY